MKSIVISLLLLIPFYGFTCDNCNVFVDTDPFNERSSIAFFYRNRIMMGQYNLMGQQTMYKHAAHGNDVAFWGNEVKETYGTYEIRGRHYYGKYWNTEVILPIIHNFQSISGENRFQLFHFGDPTILQRLLVFNSDETSKVKVRLDIGGGVKFPLGKTDLIRNEIRPNLDLQPGSGSMDFIVLSDFKLMYQKFGALVNLNYKINTFNKDDYKYGNSLNATCNLFRQVQLKSSVLTVLSGFNLESANLDESDILHEDTGGNAGFINGGLRWLKNDFVSFVTFQKSVFNHFNGQTQLINKYKFNIGLTYFLK